MSNEDDCRREFEEWARSERADCPLDRCPDGDYTDSCTCSDWHIWQVAWQAAHDLYAPKWRSMEEAPKDERILAVVDGSVHVVKYGKTWYEPFFGFYREGSGEKGLCEPTKWMSLPAVAK